MVKKTWGGFASHILSDQNGFMFVLNAFFVFPDPTDVATGGLTIVAGVVYFGFKFLEYWF